jgi:hypothetical protein
MTKIMGFIITLEKHGINMHVFVHSQGLNHKL